MPSELVMAFHPTSRGFGWVLFDGPNSLCDWGLTFVRGDENAANLRHLQWLLARIRPSILVLERFDRRTGKRASRISRLVTSVAALADSISTEVVYLSRQEIGQAVGLGAKATRQEVAERVARHLHALRHRLPRERRAWETADRRMALFNAAALALSYYATIHLLPLSPP